MLIYNIAVVLTSQRQRDSHSDQNKTKTNIHSEKITLHSAYIPSHAKIYE